MTELYSNLNIELHERGSSLNLVDLRWGITDEDANRGKVIQLCLESIKDSPYFICLLGERYGTFRDPNTHKTWRRNENQEKLS